MNNSTRGIAALHGRSYTQLEKIAHHVRKCLKYKLTDPIDGVQLFEGLDQVQIVLKARNVFLDSGCADLEPGVEAITRYDKRRDRIEILLAEDSYRGLENKFPRSLFSLVHELGHAVLHTEELFNLASIPHKSAKALHRQTAVPHAAYLDTEWQANAFGAALLMPAQAIARIESERSDVSPLILSRRFGVSMPCAQIRLEVYQNRRSELLRV